MSKTTIKFGLGCIISLLGILVSLYGMFSDYNTLATIGFWIMTFIFCMSLYRFLMGIKNDSNNR